MLFSYTNGDPATPAIVFLHGGGLSGRMWQSQMERLADYYCLAPDLPEQGKSLDSGPFRLEDAAGCVVDLIDKRVPARCAHLVGLSLGADLALAIMRIASASIDHVVVSAATPLGKFVGKLILAVATVPINYVYLEQQFRLAARMLGVPQAYRAMFCEDLLLAVNPISTRHFIEALIELSQGMPCEAEIPTLVAVGEKESMIARQAARKVAACLKQARGVIVPGVNHVWNLQAPDLFTDTVRAWIEDRPLPNVLQPLTKARTV